jgi:DNA-binding NtrC family response regulator
MKTRPPVVIVEDDDGVLEVLKVYLERRGYPVTAIANPLTALDAAAEFNGAIWLIDMRLPQMSGMALAEKVSERGTARLLVIMTGYPDDGLPGRVSAIPKAAFLRKPIGFSELNTLLESAH